MVCRGKYTKNGTIQNRESAELLGLNLIKNKINPNTITF
ncbi:hypothetical protein M124_1033 [Bacteroides fragilis str. 3988T(B)14]|uniref:Uncharacterized protein n=1 Tax=Bacteroides fragilis str. 3988T(B)14 TaxID=1339315 RepID=A0A015TWP3_BACFG|nr:hypothetical protein M124_1033 [Bacteroides fragilis str. 3988T(B)14]EXY81217.1 hypothetical protein M084_1016 [Bacteroides fragilis str. 3988 T1]